MGRTSKTKGDDTKHAGGRPTDYNSEYATDKFIDKFVRHCKYAKELVSLCGLAVYIGVCEDTIQEWRKAHPEFSVPLAKIKQISKQMLINKGLQSKYSPNMSKFCLSSNHGMSDKHDVNLSGEVVLKPPEIG